MVAHWSIANQKQKKQMEEIEKLGHHEWKYQDL